MFWCFLLSGTIGGPSATLTKWLLLSHVTCDYLTLGFPSFSPYFFVFSSAGTTVFWERFWTGHILDMCRLLRGKALGVLSMLVARAWCHWWLVAFPWAAGQLSAFYQLFLGGIFGALWTQNCCNLPLLVCPIVNEDGVIVWV